MDKPTKEFLDELVRRARRYGWGGDYTEIVSFVYELFDEAGLERPNMELSECAKCGMTKDTSGDLCEDCREK